MSVWSRYLALRALPRALRGRSGDLGRLSSCVGGRSFGAWRRSLSVCRYSRSGGRHSLTGGRHTLTAGGDTLTAGVEGRGRKLSRDTHYNLACSTTEQQENNTLMRFNIIQCPFPDWHPHTHRIQIPPHHPHRHHTHNSLPACQPFPVSLINDNAWSYLIPQDMPQCFTPDPGYPIRKPGWRLQGCPHPDPG